MSESAASRRRFLRWTFFSAVGLTIPLIAESLAKATFLAHGVTAETSSSQASFGTEKTNTASLEVKVIYLQMGQYVSVSEEQFHLRSPAVVSDLLNAVMTKHPTISPQMMNSMWILVNGTSSKTSATLKDGDEIELIPLVAGG